MVSVSLTKNLVSASCRSITARALLPPTCLASNSSLRASGNPRYLAINLATAI